MSQLEQLKAEARETILNIWPDDSEITQTVMRVVDTLIETVYQARTEEVRKLALRWYDDNYKHGEKRQEDGSTTYITEKEFDDFLATLKDTKISNE
jgi:hypothetical protein